MTTTAQLPGEVFSHDPLWIDIRDPEPHQIAEIAGHFAFHPLSIEDALDQRSQRPKVDKFEHYRFLVFYGFPAPGGGEIAEPYEISLFWTRDQIVTVHYGEAPALVEAQRRWDEQEVAFEHTPLALLHTILDTAVDSALPVIDAAGEHVEAIEDRVIAGARDGIGSDVQQVRRRLLLLRRVLAPQRDMVSSLARDSWLQGNPETSRYFDDILDHVTRAAESIDIERDIVTGVMETYLSSVSNNLNEVMKTLTIAATLLMAMSLIAGIYGMNFRHMPELDWRLGYPLALSMMLGAAVVLVGFFRHRRWL